MTKRREIRSIKQIGIILHIFFSALFQNPRAISLIFNPFRELFEEHDHSEHIRKKDFFERSNIKFFLSL